MEFNKITRGHKREVNTQEAVYSILDAGFLCHVGFQHNGQVMMIPTAFGRKNDVIYIHGSSKNFMMNALLDGQTACIAVTHLDGIVLARSLFHSSANFRSAVVFGKAILVENMEEKTEALKVITENIAKGRWDEVMVGTEQELKATMVLKIPIETASAKIRAGGPGGDDAIVCNNWTGYIPLALKALEPVADPKNTHKLPWSESIRSIMQKY